MKIVSVVGTRPQLIKAAGIQPALRARHTEVLVDTGQHWDDGMAGIFFRELGLARPDHTLGIGGGGHGEQTGRMLAALERLLLAEQPDAVMVLGDTNSTLAGALAAAKLAIPVAHVEAGLRSFDRAMPEEINRVVTDHLARWLFAPTPTAVANLAAEGITAGVHPVGDVLQDLAAHMIDQIRDPDAALRAAGEPLVAAGAPKQAAHLRPGGYLFATIHRAENREPAALANWTSVLGAGAMTDRPVILALHPGTRAALATHGIELAPGIWTVEPLGYRTTLALQLHAAAVLTDSGGIQREAAWMGTPCIVLRTSTEWIEAVANSGGRMVVAGLDPSVAADALAHLAPAAPHGRSEEVARERARNAVIPPAGAADSIADALGAGERKA